MTCRSVNSILLSAQIPTGRETFLRDFKTIMVPEGSSVNPIQFQFDLLMLIYLNIQAIFIQIQHIPYKSLNYINCRVASDSCNTCNKFPNILLFKQKPRIRHFFHNSEMCDLSPLHTSKQMKMHHEYYISVLKWPPRLSNKLLYVMGKPLKVLGLLQLMLEYSKSIVNFLIKLFDQA